MAHMNKLMNDGVEDAAELPGLRIPLEELAPPWPAHERVNLALDHCSRVAQNDLVLFEIREPGCRIGHPYVARRFNAGLPPHPPSQSASAHGRSPGITGRRA